jgi:hypothetical protein
MVLFETFSSISAYVCSIVFNLTGNGVYSLKKNKSVGMGR